MSDHTLRARNRHALLAMLEACGKKNFAEGLAHLTEDVYCDWPYRPIPDMPDSMTGRETLKAFFEQGQADFAGLAYEVQTIFELVDPNCLIAEYTSHSRHLPSGVPYSNQYLGIFRFEEGLICYWREYINPMTIKEVLAAAH